MKDRKFENVMEQQVGDNLPPETRDRFLKFAHAMDQVALVDPQTREVHLDERMLQKALEGSFPLAFATSFLAQMRADPNSRLVSSDKAGGQKSISWLDFATQQGLEPNFNPTAKSTAQPTAASPLDSNQNLRQILPGINDAALQPGVLEGRIQQIISSPTGNVTGPIRFAGPNWNAVGACCQRRLGWWFWPTIAWVLVCFMFTFPNLALGAIIAGASVGLGTATIIVNCILTS